MPKRLVNWLLEGPLRKYLEGARQRQAPWGSWHYSSNLDTSPFGWFEPEEQRRPADGPDDANLISSKVGEDEHVVALDVDLPMRAVPSTTPGRGHLYIDKKLTWAQYVELLDALSAAGIVHPSYVKHSKARGYTCLRPAFIAKPKNQPKRFGSDWEEPE